MEEGDGRSEREGGRDRKEHTPFHSIKNMGPNTGQVRHILSISSLISLSLTVVSYKIILYIN